MRKLRPAEVALLVAGLTIGTDNINADESGSPLATVTVTGTYNLQTQFIFPVGIVGSDAAPGVGGTNSVQVQNGQRHAIDCVQAYDDNIPWGVGPKPGWQTYVTTNYGWKMGIEVYTTTTNTPPPGYEPIRLFGVSTPKYGNPFLLGTTYIFLSNNPTTAELINTIAHEFAHQWGANEDQATATGNTIENLYKNDNGRKCGGL